MTAEMQKWKWGNLLNEGFQNEFQEGYQEITPDAGIPFRRLRFSDIQDIITGTLSLDDNSYIEFMSWFKHDIRQGTLPFKFYDCRVKRERTARLTINKPVFQRFSNRWNLPLTLALDSEVINEKRYLAGNTKRLIANGGLLESGVKRYL